MTIANRAAAVLIGVGVIGALVAGGGVRAASRPPLKDFLSKAGFTASELAALERGEAVVRVLEEEVVGPNDTAEIAVGGAIRVDVPRQLFIDELEDVRGFRSNSYSGIGIIQNPPRAYDFAAVTIPEDDVQDLRECEPGEDLGPEAGPDPGLDLVPEST